MLDQPSVDLLNWSKEHLYYELRILIECIQYQEMPGMSYHGHNWHKSIWLEAFLLHFRNLYEFLYLSQRKVKTDARAVDFYDDSVSWEKIRPKPSLELKADKKRVDQWISHLTYLRPPEAAADREWNVSQIAHELSETIKLFLTTASREQLHPTVQELANLL